MSYLRQVLHLWIMRVIFINFFLKHSNIRTTDKLTTLSFATIIFTHCCSQVTLHEVEIENKCSLHPRLIFKLYITKYWITGTTNARRDLVSENISRLW